MSTTPKSIVIAKHKSAECYQLGSHSTFVIDTPSRRMRGGQFLGSGKTNSTAWKDAARRIRRAPLENKKAVLLAKSRVAAALAQAHWFNSIHGGLINSRRAQEKRLSETFHAEAVRLDKAARRLRK